MRLVKCLFSPSRNPVRDQQYEAQITYYNLPVKKRQLQTRLKQATNGGQRYKQAYIKKVLSRKNRGERVHYGAAHLDKTIHDFWQYIYFTDEAHLDPSSQAQGYILRERGTRTNTENIQERGEKTGVKLHIFAWVNWWGKSEKLYFYNDEEEHVERPQRPPKPRKRMYETAEEFHARIREWEASLPPEKVVKPKGNGMTQKYYTDKLLPVYVDAIHKARSQPGGELKNWILQEDGDPSHGKRKKGLAQVYLESNWVPVLRHPPQSPDLNPAEGVWNILKQRVRQRTWRSLEEYKVVLQDEWSKITLEEIRARILEIPDRCKQLVETGGAPIKGDLW
jgi:DDE superfamily endonuclease